MLHHFSEVAGPCMLVRLKWLAQNRIKLLVRVANVEHVALAMTRWLHSPHPDPQRLLQRGSSLHVSTPGEISFPWSALLCLQLGPQRGGAGGGNQTRPSWPLCVSVLPHAPSKTVNHPELLTGFVILNRAWTQLSRGESTMSYCNSFCQPILSWTQQYFNLKIQPQNPQHFQLLYFITTQLKTSLFFFFQPPLFF